MAVHFWPAFTVISVTTPLTKRSSSGSESATSGPRIETFNESASTCRVTPRCSTDGWLRRTPAVCADPVKATESCTSRVSSSVPALPHNS